MLQSYFKDGHSSLIHQECYEHKLPVPPSVFADHLVLTTDACLAALDMYISLAGLA